MISSDGNSKLKLNTKETFYPRGSKDKKDGSLDPVFSAFSSFSVKRSNLNTSPQVKEARKSNSP